MDRIQAAPKAAYWAGHLNLLGPRLPSEVLLEGLAESGRVGSCPWTTEDRKERRKAGRQASRFLRCVYVCVSDKEIDKHPATEPVRTPMPSSSIDLRPSPPSPSSPSRGGWPIEFPDSLPPSLPFTFTYTFKRRLPRHLCLPSPLHLDKLATAAPTTTIPLVYNFLRGRRAQHVACPEVAPQQQGGPIIPLLRRSACSLTSRARPPPQPRACV